MPSIHIALGWFLGILTNFIKDWLERRRLEKEFKETLITELKEITYRLVGNYILLGDIFVCSNRDNLAWAYSMVTAFPEGMPEDTIRLIEGLSKLNDNEHAQVQRVAPSKDESKALFVPKFSVPFLEENITSLTMLDSSLQRFILDIRRNIGWLNENIDRTNFFYERTFDHTVSEKNHLTMRTEIQEGYKRMGELCRKTAELCKEAISKLDQ